MCTGTKGSYIAAWAGALTNQSATHSKTSNCRQICFPFIYNTLVRTLVLGVSEFANSSMVVYVM
jgi:hypothetical protein